MMNKHLLAFRWVVFCLNALILLYSVNLYAAPSASDWMKTDKRFKEFCQQKVLDEKARVFADTAVKANLIRSDFCAGKITSDKGLELRIVSLLDDLNRLFVNLDYAQKLKSWESRRIQNNTGLAILEVNTINSRLFLALEEHHVEIQSVNKCNVVVTSISGSGDCKSALIEFKRIYNFAQATLSQPKALSLVRYLGGLEKQWDDFYANGRSETIWEMLINGSRFQSSNEAYKFMPPPDSQIIFMHPGVVIENVADAHDGEQSREALMLEVVGINWWRNNKWYKPSGLSAIALYADRAGVDDTGYGIAIHFASKFSIGYANHGGAHGYFITIDLLQLLEDKKTLLNEYRGSADFMRQ